jgi:hypothetical protein
MRRSVARQVFAPTPTGDATGARRPEGALGSAADVSAKGPTDRERQDPSLDGAS